MFVNSEEVAAILNESHWYHRTGQIYGDKLDDLIQRFILLN